MTPAPSDKPLPPSSPRPLDRRDQNQAPARGTRGGGYGEEPGAPRGVWAEGAQAAAAPAAAPAKAPAKSPTAPGQKTVPVPVPGATVPKSVAAAPKPPVPTAFPPPELKAECEALIARYPEKIAALIPILHLAQRRLGGWISPELEAGIAAFLGCSDQHVRGVLTFYTMFNTKPVGRHHVQVCRTLSCWLRGAKGITKAVEAKAGIRCGETDKDGRFTLTEVECLGLCEVAPVVHVNDMPHVSLTPDKVSALLDGLK